MRLLVTRPEADARAFAERLAERGVESVIAPVMTVVFDDHLDVGLDGVQAVLLTSANGARALARCTERRDLSVVAVGPATAEEARELGFGSVATAGGDVEKLADLAIERLRPAAGPLLHVAGSVTAGDLAGRLKTAGFAVERAVAYRAQVFASLPAAAHEALTHDAVQGAVFFSPRTVAVFVKLARAAGVEDRLQGLQAFCLSQAVAEASQSAAWREVLVAAQPDGGALIDLICSALTD
ncbi:MAG: uroporphyrinogen-III synthase [Pseudomonadota bacterium]